MADTPKRRPRRRRRTAPAGYQYIDQRRPGTAGVPATIESVCDLCGGHILLNQLVTKRRGTWVHTGCMAGGDEGKGNLALIAATALVLALIGVLVSIVDMRTGYVIGWISGGVLFVAGVFALARAFTDTRAGGDQ